MDVSNVWEYLDNVWVLAGLVLVVLTGFLKLLPVKKLDSKATERLVHKGINYLFILGLVSIVLGFMLFQNSKPATTLIGQDTVSTHTTQTIINNTGTAINTIGNVNQSPPPTPDRIRSERSPDTVNQQIKDNSGVAINADGDISINHTEK